MGEGVAGGEAVRGALLGEGVAGEEAVRADSLEDANPGV